MAPMCGGLYFPAGFCGRRGMPYQEVISPRMSHRSVNRFNQREVARALRAARLAGERPERVEIDPATGRIAIIIAKSGDAPPAAPATNEWDEVAK
jgi:hypothetical protein